MLLDELRKVSAATIAAKAAQQTTDLERKLRSAANIDVQKARALIHDLPALFEREAVSTGATSMIVMTLEKGLHFAGDVDRVIRECDLHGNAEGVLLNGALEIARWLRSQKLRVEIVKVPRNDEGQGRSWFDVNLIAVWAE